MRLAIISDIHANDVALTAVLADIAQDAPDEIICLGDVATGGPQPAAVVARLREIGCAGVMGNTDEDVLNPEKIDKNDDKMKIFNEWALWSADILPESALAYLRSFQPILIREYDAGNRSLLFCHGSPVSNTDQILVDTDEDILPGYLADIEATAVFCGHTHTPMIRRFQDKAIVNPGSVGLPFIQSESATYNPLWAEYALVEVEGTRLDISLKRVPLHRADLQRAAAASRMPHVDYWLQDWREVS